MSSDGGATWSTNCAGAPNTPDDRMWFAGSGAAASGNLTLYQDYDAVDGALPSGGNQLVETVSHDGTHFTPVLNTAGLTTGCTGADVNCVTDNEGISGNQVVDPATGNMYIAHTTTNGNSAGGTPRSPGLRRQDHPGNHHLGHWTESPNLDAALCPDSSCVDAAGNPEELAGENFASIARDAAGYLYVAFTAGPLDHASSSDPNFGALTAPEQIYVVHSLATGGSDPAALTWSAPSASAAVAPAREPTPSPGSPPAATAASTSPGITPASAVSRAPAPAARASARCTAPGASRTPSGQCRWARA